jgi:DNA-binding MarR family transcriptional regulator
MVFHLKKLPKEEILKQIACRYSETDLAVIDGMLQLLRFASELERVIETHFGKYGLSPARFTTLMMLLGKKEQGMSPSELAECLGVTRGNMTGLLDGLEKAEFILRENDPSDRRAVMIKISELGMTHLNRILPDHYRKYALFLNEITLDEQFQFLECIQKLRMGMSKLL